MALEKHVYHVGLHISTVVSSHLISVNVYTCTG